jgi:predicted RecA/RadA family phage recombinase
MLFGGIPGIVCEDCTTGNYLVLAIEGVFEIPKESGKVFTVGQSVYIQGGQATDIEGSDALYFGMCMEDESTTVYVKLDDFPARTEHKYVALLTQTGTNAPVATILKNTLGAIVWGYTSPGVYTATLAGAFTATTAVKIANAGIGVHSPEIMEALHTSGDVITVRTFLQDVGATDNDMAGTNAILSGTLIEITVY